MPKVIAAFSLALVALSANPLSLAPQSSSSVAIDAGLAPVPFGELYYEVAGSGEPIVLVHGNAGDLRHWDRQVDDLAQRYRVIRYDVRGFGRSSNPVEGGTYSHHGDLAALLDHLGISGAHVMGWSMGSSFAIDFALAYPERTRSVISVGPWFGGFRSEAVSDMFSDMGAVNQAARERGSEAAVEAWMSAPFFAETIRDPEAGEFFRHVASAQSFLPSGISNPRVPLDPPAAERLGELEAALLIITAEHDIPACVEMADLLDGSVDGARRVTMSGTGHLMHIERPEEFNTIILEFLDSVSAR